MKREPRTPIVTVIRRGPPHAPDVAPAAPAASPGRAPAPAPIPSAPPSARTDEQRLRDRQARLVARAAPHAEAIRSLLDQASAANGGAWPRQIHATIADALGLPRSVVRAFLGTLQRVP